MPLPIGTARPAATIPKTVSFCSAATRHSNIFRQTNHAWPVRRHMRSIRRRVVDVRTFIRVGLPALTRTAVHVKMERGIITPQTFRHVQTFSVAHAGGFGRRAVVQIMPRTSTSAAASTSSAWIMSVSVSAPPCMFICVLSANRQASHEASRERVSAVSLLR